MSGPVRSEDESPWTELSGGNLPGDSCIAAQESGPVR